MVARSVVRSMCIFWGDVLRVVLKVKSLKVKQKLIKSHRVKQKEYKSHRVKQEELQKQQSPKGEKESGQHITSNKVDTEELEDFY